jgi:hypothetical protein
MGDGTIREPGQVGNPAGKFYTSITLSDHPTVEM